MIKDYGRDIVLLKLTTDRHEASRGLSATAELLVTILGEMTDTDKRIQTSGSGLMRKSGFASRIRFWPSLVESALCECSCYSW